MKYHCKVCQHDWFPRMEGKPKVCPKCGSEYWDRGRQRAPRSQQLAEAPIKRINAAVELLTAQGFTVVRPEASTDPTSILSIMQPELLKLAHSFEFDTVSELLDALAMSALQHPEQAFKLVHGARQAATRQAAELELAGNGSHNHKNTTAKPDVPASVRRRSA